MDFIHAREYLEAGDIAIVQCSHQCNVRLMTDQEFQAFRAGREHRYYGGFYQMLPARIVVPHSDWWNVTLDLGGGSANIQYSINYLKRAA